MRQKIQSVLSPDFRRWLWFAIVVAGLCLAVVNSASTRAQQQQPSTNNSNRTAQAPRTKRLTPLRTRETADGSRVTITSDRELNDYSAYRSGNRFIVVVPQAEGAGGGGARGRGFEGAQVERRGKDLVYTFKLEPGATARVNQRFNSLDVQFTAPRSGGQATTANANTRPAATPAPTPNTRGTLLEDAGTRQNPANANLRPTPDPRLTQTTNANSALPATGATPFAIPSPDAATTNALPTPTLVPTSTPAGAEQIAQAQPTGAAPAVPIVTNAPSGTSASFGAVIARNWTWLVAALLAIGIGLLVFSRFGGDKDRSRSLPPAAPSGAKPVTTVKETKPAELKPSTASTASTTGATATTTAAGATAAAAALAESGKQSKKKKKKAEKAKRLAAATELKTGGATATSSTSTSSAAKPTGDANAAGGALAAGAIIAGVGTAAAAGGASKVDESKAGGTQAAETKAVEPKAVETKAVVPSVAFDPERIEGEIKKLLSGEPYDESLVNATDTGTRQLVSAELMSSIAGRNLERREHARAAFLKHGYFEEATGALQSAEAPAERAAAARTLGLFGDRSATPHLVAALEDPSADVRRTAVEALAELRDPAATGALEALRWRETSRQVPRTLIQRAIEASNVEEEEVTAITPAAEDDDTPTLVTKSSAVALAESGAAEVEPQETATKEIEVVDAAAQTETAEAPAPSGLNLGESPSLAATVTEEMPQTPVAPEASSSSEIAPAVETETAIEEVRPVVAIEPVPVETKSIELSDATDEPTVETKGEVDAAATTTPLPTDLAATLAAKESSLIRARQQQQESETAESLKATEAAAPVVAGSPVSASPALETPALETPAPVVESVTPVVTDVELQAIDEVTLETRAPEAQPVYHSDFSVGQKPAVGDDDWIDLEAVEPAASSPAPAEPLGPFYAEGASVAAPPRATTTETPAQTDSGRHEAVTVFDSLEVEALETNAAEAAPITATPVARVLDAAAPTQPLDAETHAFAFVEEPRGTEIVKADKGLGIVDGSDEDDYSIIPKGIQERLTSDDVSERAASVLALARLDTDEAFNEICTAFDDSAEEVRNAAARALYDLTEDRADSFTRALRESSPERRRQIGAALAGSGLADEAIGNLTGESRDKTYDAFSLLFLMAKAGEVAPLIRAIESHPDSEVRLAVVKLLALSGQQEILPAFRRLAVRGSLPTEVRSAVMEAIYQISSQPQNATPAT